MVTIASTPEKTLETLTGQECIPLSDKTHIKTSILKTLAEQLQNVLDKVDDTAMYKKDYDFTSASEIAAVKADDTISFENHDDNTDSFSFSGTVNISVPHRGKYYVTLENVTFNEECMITINGNMYNAGKVIVNIFTNVSSIAFTTTGSISVEHIVIAETPMDIAEMANEEIDKRKSYVDGGCLTLVL